MNLILGSFKFCDIDADGWISREDLLESIELVHQLMGNMFQLTNNNNKRKPNSFHDGIDKEAEFEFSTLNNDDDDDDQETFTPQNRTAHLFNLMDEDRDGKADYDDFKRTVLNEADIIQGFLVYDGVI